jgi:hypothetical protein
MTDAYEFLAFNRFPVEPLDKVGFFDYILENVFQENVFQNL